MTVALAFLAALQLPPFESRAAPSATVPTIGAVTFRTDATSAEIVAAGAQVIEGYGPFAFARGTEGSLAMLRGLGRYAEAYAGASTLVLLGGSVDVTTLALNPSPAWSIDPLGHAIGIVHFHSPIKVEWRTELESRGLAVLRYLPQDALVVRGNPAVFQSVASLPAVDWAGPYQPSWKLRTGMASAGVVDVRIVMFPGEHPEMVEAWLAHHGIPAAAWRGSEPALLGAFGSGDFLWVRARVPAALTPLLADLPAVEFIDPVQSVHALNAETDWVIQTNRTLPTGAGDYRYWRYGLDARGQAVGMADTGLDYDGDQFRHSSATITLGDIYNVTDPARRKVVRYVNMGVLTGQLTWPGGGGTWDPASIKDCAMGHGTGVASTLAGNDNGIGLSPNDGNALLAKIYLQDVGGLQGTLCPDERLIYLPENYDNLFGPSGLVYNDPLAPVRVHSDSWGADTNVYDVQARMVDAFVWAHPDMTILFAAGNAGSTAASVGTPATAKDIVAVGGALNPDSFPFLPGAQNDLAAASSRGPTVDGRIAPTILSIFDGDSAMSDGDPTSRKGNPDAHWAGTSYATPAAAAAAAIVRQYFVDGWYPAGRPVAQNSMNPSAALVRAMLIASGVQVTGAGTVARSPTDTWPNNEQGFGRILLSTVLPIAAANDTFATQVVSGTSGLLTGDVSVHAFHVGVAGPVKFVLAWSDYPGTLGATKALVNDLDLLVTAPDGTRYRGNHFAPFAQGQSLPGGQFDTTNVEEAVILKNAMVGDWSVQVIGANVPVGPQAFALVATGNLDRGYGRITLDRVAYSEADTIRIAVEDSDATSVVVHVVSGIEPGGENVTLSRSVPDEVWRGSIRTAFGSATSDGVLQVREGDAIAALYQDASPPHTAVGRAKIFASGPAIHDVSVTAIGASTATVRWSTDAPATTEIRYGTNPASLTSGGNVSELRTGHAITLSRLKADTLYYFTVTSRGRLGNATTDANGGLDYTFHTAPLGDILLVIGGDSFPPEREASYATALAGNGWTWSTWRVAELGLPSVQDLQARRAVIWQVGLEQYPPFNATARGLIKSYLDGGGRLIVSSHDTSWALGSLTGSQSSPFATPDSEAWVRGVMKASFVCDPGTISQVRGVSSDPISGSYSGGVGYTPHRIDGADDQISPNSAGGSVSTMWTDVNLDATCAHQNQPNGLRWVSSSPNGTAGTGVWGGNFSRLAYFAFEITGIDTSATDLNPKSTTRAAILDAALRWLVSTAPGGLDRDHPDVNITSPNGGLFAGPTITINWTAAAYGTGVTISNFTLASTADGGQTWTPVANVSGSARTYAWNLGTTANGNRYSLKIVAHDSGRPSLSGADTTDTTFTIARPGGDSQGPTLWAGSVRVNPRPPGAAQLVQFNATADDRSRGASAIAAAEMFLRTTPPAPGDTGSGRPMLASDGAFNGPVENVSWQGGLAAPPGVTCAWVHARDAPGNWGPYASLCFVVIFAGPDSVPPALASIDGVRLTNGSNDLAVGWLPPWDEGLYGGTKEYHVFRSTSPRGTPLDISGPILGNGSFRYTYIDRGRGADASDYFYRIRTIDTANFNSNSTTLGVKVRMPFAAGLNLLGVPVDLTNRAVGTLLPAGAWSDAWSYDACSGGFRWSSSLPSDGLTFSLPQGRGFWLNGTAAGSFMALGVVTQTVQVRLCAGWNLIALPGFAAGLTVQDVMTATGADHVMGFDSAGPYHVRDLAASDAISVGRGYWVHVAADVNWNVAGW